MSSLIIPFPAELRARLPTIVGNVDYLTLRRRLEEIDEILRTSEVERLFVEQALEPWLQEKSASPSARQQQQFQLRSRRALRCTVLRTLLQEDYRGFSCQLAGNPLYQWFCLIDTLDVVRVPSKSELQRYAHWVAAPTMRALVNRLLQSGLQESEALHWEQPLDLEQYFLDTTCLQANIHFPVDWLLLRDGVRTLLKATTLIREQGLKGRMEPPEEFLRRINRLCIQMTHQGRHADSQKGRKRVLRRMKRLVNIVRDHARRHRELLDQQWEKTAWTRPQAEVVLRRIDRLLELLPQAQQQAHRRIIGERPVANADKLLSLYETDVRVLVRGKAGAAVEFGNTVLIGENRQGIILDYQIWQEPAPADTDLLVESLERVVEGLGCAVGGVGADRGFASASNSRGLADCGIFDALCPRNPRELKRRMKEKKFARMQRRRSQTEGRISILKQGFFGRPMRAKGFAHRELALAWGVLTHNLWRFARLRQQQKKEESLRQVA